ncbi:unnamed protein product [Trichobilharzia szidati]|nr:unnamed protein product [Trichobilharzia szidati]
MNQESQPDSYQSEGTESYVYDEQLTNNPQFESETPESQPDSYQSESTESYVYDEQLTNNPQFESETPDDLNSTLDAYADSYREAVDYKFRMTEIQKFKDRWNFKTIIKPEILRLEHLYQSKWAKEFLESIGAEDKKLVDFSTDEYRKALEKDTSFNYKVLANKGLYNKTKLHISKKWENRKNLDIAEGKYFAETSGNLKKDEVQIEMIKKHLKEAKEAVKTSREKLQWLEEAAVTATHQNRDILNFFRTSKKRRYRSDILYAARVNEVYQKARINFAIGTKELGEKIKLLEMKRIEFFKFQTLEDRIKLLLTEMKEDAKQFY